MVKKLGICLRFQGNCEEAFNFYKSVFGGELIMLQRYKEMREKGYKIRKKDENKLTFVALPIGKDNVLTGDDNINLESNGQVYIQGNNYIVSVDVESKGEADRIYGALSAGGTIKIPIAYQFWGTYCGYFTDKFGVEWGVEYRPPRIKE